MGDEAAAVAQRPAQGGEERVVVGDPVERRGREDDVDPLAAEIEADEVGDAEVDAVLDRLGERPTIDYVRLNIDATAA